VVSVIRGDIATFVAARDQVFHNSEYSLVFMESQEPAFVARTSDGKAKQEWVDIANENDYPLWVARPEESENPAHVHGNTLLVGPGVVACYARFPKTPNFPQDALTFHRRAMSRIDTIFEEFPEIRNCFAHDEMGNFAGGIIWEQKAESYHLSTYSFLNHNDCIAFIRDDIYKNMYYNECHFESIEEHESGSMSALVEKNMFLITKMLTDEFNVDIQEYTDSDIIIDEEDKSFAEENYRIV